MANAPIAVPSKLHNNPTATPQFSTTLINSKGEEVVVACPTATRALVALMDMEAVVGGAACHFGGPSAFAEIMAALHGFMFRTAAAKDLQWHQCFHFVNDAGHCENGIYALKANYHVAGLDIETLKTFRSLESSLTGHGEAHLFPASVYISNGPLGSALPQAQGLAAAENLAAQPRTTITTISDGGCMEGEAREALAAIPGLAGAGRLGPFICIISDNNTKLSGRIDEDSFSMQPTFKSLTAQGWDVTFVEDGHQLQTVYRAIEGAAEKAITNRRVPQLIWCKTIKGKGVRATENSSSGGHGFPVKKPADIGPFISEIYGGGNMPKEIKDWVDQLEAYEKAPEPPPRFPGERIKVQTGLSEALIEKYSAGLPIISISADLQESTGVAGFRHKFPEAAFEVGVAEANMVSMAIGLSKQGYIPVVDTFAQFGVTKGALPLLMSGLSEGPIIAVYSHTGFQDAADGASHQALTYIAMTSAVPNVDVFVLSCSAEAKQLMKQALERFASDRAAGKIPRSTIFFLGRENFCNTYGEINEYQLGKAQIVKKAISGYNRAVTIIAPGPMLEVALLAQLALEKKEIGSIVVHPSAINYPDLETIGRCVAETNGYLVTIEDHRVVGGFGSLLAHAFTQKGVPIKMKSLGVKDHFGRSAYQAKHLYDQFGLGVLNVVEAATTFFA